MKFFETEGDRIKQDEGSVKVKGNHVSYKDSLGYLTGGYGHLLTRKEREMYPEGTVIPDTVVDHWFKKDLQEAEDVVKKITKGWDIPVEVEMILINMAFNLGETRLRGFKKMLKAVANKDYEEAAKQMKDSEWATQVKSRATRLIKRMRSLSNETEHRVRTS